MTFLGRKKKSGKRKISKALLGLYERPDIVREDRELFQKTVSDLKKEEELAFENKSMTDILPKDN